MNPYAQIKITSGICSSLAVVTTIHRIFIRFRRVGLWFDDAFALLATLSLAAQVVAIFLPPKAPSGVIGTVKYYMLIVSLYVVIWSARLSLLFSLIRIEPKLFWARIWKFVAVAFGIAGAVLLAQLFWVCEPQRPKWKELPDPQCYLGKNVAISQLITDILADSALIYIPIRMFRVLLDKNLRIRLILIFSTCVITTIVSLVRVSFIIVSGGPREILAGTVESALSLIVCNIPLCAAHILRRRKWYEEEANENDTSPPIIWLKRIDTSTSPSRTSACTRHVQRPMTSNDSAVVTVYFPTPEGAERPCDVEAADPNPKSPPSGESSYDKPKISNTFMNSLQ